MERYKQYCYFDNDVLSSLEAIMGGALTALFREYDIDTRRRLDLIDGLIKDGKGPRQIQLVAHSIRGSSGNVGAASMVDLCRQLEAATQEASMPKVEQAFFDVKQHFDAMQSELIELTQHPA